MDILYGAFVYGSDSSKTEAPPAARSGWLISLFCMSNNYPNIHCARQIREAYTRNPFCSLKYLFSKLVTLCSNFIYDRRNCVTSVIY